MGSSGGEMSSALWANFGVDLDKSGFEQLVALRGKWVITCAKRRIHTVINLLNLLICGFVFFCTFVRIIGHSAVCSAALACA